MSSANNERGTVMIFATLMIVLLLIIVGMGLDSGNLVYSRSMGQAAVDAAALAAVSAIPSRDTIQVHARAAVLTDNNYVNSAKSPITKSNVTLVKYDDLTNTITAAANINDANGVRVAMESSNPYDGGAAKTPILTPAFLTPLMRIFGTDAPSVNHVNVSAVAAMKAVPGIPVAVMTKTCGQSGEIDLLSQNTHDDNMCWTAYLETTSTASVKALFNASHSCTGLATQGDIITINTEINLMNGVGGAYGTAEDVLITKNKGKCWYVPVIPNVTKGGCNQSEPVLDWAKICPTKISKSGADSTIRTSVTCGQSLYNASANLCFSTRLLRDVKSGM